jgi:hypothetical protein
MADTKISALTELTTVANEDLFAVVDDPSGTPTTKKITLASLKTSLGLTGTNSGDQTLPTRDSLGLDTDDTPDFASVSLSKSAGNNRSVFLKTGTENRLEIGASSGAETGSDAGSDLFVNTYDDNGDYKATPIYMSRANGDMVFTGKLQVPSIELGHATDTTIARVSAGIASIEGNNIITANRTASDTVAGIVELATDAEMTTGTATDRAITPANAKVELDKKLALAGGTMTGAIVPADHGTATSPQVVAVVYGTGAAPTASTTPEGTLFVQYTA